MKKTILILIACASMGCGRNKATVTNKTYPKQGVICTYEYSRYSYGYTFQDSCNKYSVGDTINFH